MTQPEDVASEDGEFDFPDIVPYARSTFSFAASGNGWLSRQTIRTIEWMTGKITVMRIVRGFEKSGRKFETTLWAKIFDLLDITLDCPEEQLARIPKTGPTVIVANHPFGFIDGVALANLVVPIRSDFRILTRSFFSTVQEIEEHLMPVAFPHEDDSVKKNIELRKNVMEHLANGGVIMLFPAGRVATSKTFFGPAHEHVWNPFTAKMILRSKARVVPVFFPGQNSRAYQIAQMISPTLRQSLMLHEIVHARHSTLRPVIGKPIERDEIDPWRTKPTEFMAYLRERTLKLGETGG